MFAATNACAVLGAEALSVRVEANVERGLPSFRIVGLHQGDAGEARERVRCALAALGVELPLMRVTVSLAPADLPKGGAAFDVAIALAVLAAMGQVAPPRVGRICSQAELGLGGMLRDVLGTMAGALCAARAGMEAFVVAPGSAGRAAHASLPVIAAQTLADVVAHLCSELPIAPSEPARVVEDCADAPDLRDVRGQELAVRALEIAAAGGHNLLLHGPPGCGKTMLATRMPSVLPPLDGNEALEVATIHDAAGIASSDVSTLRPFRAPHHSASQQALVGGGSTRAVVGEVSLAHRGVLFLDELPEFRPSAIDALRQPLEDRSIVIRRARWRVRYPAGAQVVAAMNRCRCGRFGSSVGEPCSCTDVSRRAYLQRVSGAVIDRFDIIVGLDLPAGAISALRPATDSASSRARVASAWALQRRRWGESVRNGHVRRVTGPSMRLASSASALFAQTVDRRHLSGRSQAAALRVARTIADLRGGEDVERPDIALAVELIGRDVLQQGLEA